MARIRRRRESSTSWSSAIGRPPPRPSRRRQSLVRETVKSYPRHDGPWPPGPPASVDFHFDLMCPFAYQAARWIRSVRDETGLAVHWRFFSLEEVNRAEGKKHPWERPWSYGWSMMRIGAWLRRRDMALLD